MQLSLSQKLRIGAYVVGRSITSPRFPEYRPDKVEAFYPDPHPIYKKARKEKPLFFCPQQAAWILIAPSDLIQSVRKDPRFTLSHFDWKFSKSREESMGDDLARLNANLLMSMNKDDHNRVRRLVSPAFNPRTVDKLEDDIQAMIDEHLSTIKPGDTFNFIDIAEQIPLQVMATYVGVHPDFSKQFKDLADSVVSNYDPTIKINHERAMDGYRMITSVIDEKKQQTQALIDAWEDGEKNDTNNGESLDDYVIRHSKDFLTSVLVKMLRADEGQLITYDEVLSLIASVLAAGPDTTRDHLAWVVYGMVKHNHFIPEVLADDSLKMLDKAITESFRWNNLGHSGGVRFALEDVELHGITIKKGEMVRTMNCAVYRDEERFPDTDTFRLDRDTDNEVIMFGIGSHYCLGAAMAKKITRMTLHSLIQRFPNIRIAEEPVFRENMMTRRMRSLMLTA